MALVCVLLLQFALSGVAEAQDGSHSPPLPGYYAQTPLPRTGKATYYNPGVMQQVLKNRARWGQLAHCPDCVGYVAMLRVGDMGRKARIRHNDIVIGPLLVVDVATPRDFERLKDDGWAIDVSWELAQVLNMRGPITVTVYDADPLATSPPDTASASPC